MQTKRVMIRMAEEAANQLKITAIKENTSYGIVARAFLSEAQAQYDAENGDGPFTDAVKTEVERLLEERREIGRSTTPYGSKTKDE